MAVRKIMTKSEIEKKSRRNQILVGAILVGLMIMSTLGYSLLSGEKENSGAKTLTYKGLDFYNNGEWHVVINGKTLSFLYSPLEVENIEEALEELKSKGIKLIDEKPRIGAGGARIAFLHPKSTNGILVELCERK